MFLSSDGDEGFGYHCRHSLCLLFCVGRLRNACRFPAGVASFVLRFLASLSLFRLQVFLLASLGKTVFALFFRFLPLGLCTRCLKTFLTAKDGTGTEELNLFAAYDTFRCGGFVELPCFGNALAFSAGENRRTTLIENRIELSIAEIARHLGIAGRIHDRGRQNRFGTSSCNIPHGRGLAVKIMKDSCFSLLPLAQKRYRLCRFTNAEWHLTFCLHRL